MYTLTIGFFGTLPQPPKIMCLLPGFYLPPSSHSTHALVMGHNVQITYILRGIQDIQAGYCVRRWCTLSDQTGDLKID